MTLPRAFSKARAKFDRHVLQAFEGVASLDLDIGAEITVDALIDCLSREVGKLFEIEYDVTTSARIYRCSGKVAHYFRERGDGQCRYDGSTLKIFL